MENGSHWLLPELPDRGPCSRILGNSWLKWGVYDVNDNDLGYTLEIQRGFRALRWGTCVENSGDSSDFACLGLTARETWGLFLWKFHIDSGVLPKISSGNTDWPLCFKTGNVRRWFWPYISPSVFLGLKFLIKCFYPLSPNSKITADCRSFEHVGCYAPLAAWLVWSVTPFGSSWEFIMGYWCFSTLEAWFNSFWFPRDFWASLPISNLHSCTQSYQPLLTLSNFYLIQHMSQLSKRTKKIQAYKIQGYMGPRFVHKDICQVS